MFILKIFSLCLVTIALIVGGIGYLGALVVQPNHEKKVEKVVEAHILPWTAPAKAEVLKAHKRALIHFTGDACLDCKFQWGAVNEQRLLAEAVRHRVQVYSATLHPGADNNFVLSELKEYGQGGVPAYILLDSAGKPTIIKERLREIWQVTPTEKGTDILISYMKDLK